MKLCSNCLQHFVKLCCEKSAYQFCHNCCSLPAKVAAVKKYEEDGMHPAQAMKQKKKQVVKEALKTALKAEIGNNYMIYGHVDGSSSTTTLIIGSDGLVHPGYVAFKPAAPFVDPVLAKCRVFSKLRMVYAEAWDLDSTARGYLYVGLEGYGEKPKEWVLGHSVSWTNGIESYINAPSWKCITWVDALKRRAKFGLYTPPVRIVNPSAPVINDACNIGDD